MNEAAPVRRPPTRRMVAALTVGLVALLATLAGVQPARAQESGPAVEITGIDLSEFPTVQLRAALSPELAADLDAGQLEVTENGEAVETQVEPLADQVVSVLLAVDTSGSIAGEGLSQAKLAALDLLEVLPADAPVSVVAFGATAQTVSDYTTDRGETEAAIVGLDAAGGTALYDALVLAGQQAAASGAERNAILVLSDGADSDSEAGLEQAAEVLASGIDDFYVVSLQTEETDTEALTSLADAAGGRVVAAADPDALSATYVDLGQRIVNQYRLTFTSTTPDRTGTFTVGVAGTEASGSVEVALPDRQGGVADDTDDEPAEQALPGVLTTEREPGLLQQEWALYVGAGLVAIALAIAVVLAVPAASDSGRARRVASRRSLGTDASGADDHNPAERAFENVRDAATRFASRAVARTESTGRIDAALDRAGLVMRAGEFVALVVAVAIVATFVGYLLLGVVGGALGLLLPVFGATPFLRFKASRRNAAFADQLSDSLLIMSGSLRSGFGVGQAIDTVAEEMDAPIGDEFRRAILESRLGRDIEDALDGIARRVQNEDFEWVVDAMRINRQVGGDLATILDQVSETIRARNRLQRQVSALTAEGRISALVLGVLPIGMGLILYSSNPDYMDPLFSRTIGWVMLGVAAGLLAVGALWLKKLIDIEY